MLLTTISLSPAQADLVTTVIVGSPWFKNKANHCEFVSGSGRGSAKLTFQCAYGADRSADNWRLRDHLKAAALMGYSPRTVQALDQKIAIAAHKRFERRRVLGE